MHLTQKDTVYAATVNLLGSDPNPPEIQECLDREHRAADRTHPLRVARRWLRSLTHWNRYYHVDQPWARGRRTR